MGGMSASLEVDKSKELRVFVSALERETSARLTGANIEGTDLTFGDPTFDSDGRKQFTGSVGIKIRIDKGEPEFLDEEDRSSWRAALQKEFRAHFKDIHEYMPDKSGFSYFSIDFSEVNEKSVPTPTEKSKTAIAVGFEKVQEYVNFYTTAVDGYERIIEEYRYNKSKVPEEHRRNMSKFLGDLKLPPNRP